MKHTLRKLLAVLLAVMMILPMATQAFALGGVGDGFGGGLGDIGPIEPLPFEPDEELPEEEAPAEESEFPARVLEYSDGINFEISADIPEGALPAAALLHAERVNELPYGDAAAEALGEAVAPVLAFELWFTVYNMYGELERVEPALPVRVTVRSLDLSEVDARLVMIPQWDEPAEVELLESPADYVREFELTEGADFVFAVLPAEGEEEPEPATLDYIDGDGLAVYVDVPAGALPRGAQLDVNRVNPDAYAAQAAEALGLESANVALALDISFYGRDGAGRMVEYEPTKDVTVYINAPELADIADPQIVHIPDYDEPERVDTLLHRGGEIVFSAQDFSVYAIVGGGTDIPTQPYRATYEFYNYDGSKYYFKDAAGNDQYTQILKNGEILEDVGIPAGASKNAKFVGWYVWDGSSETLGEKVNVDEAKTVTANVTIKLKAKLQGIVNVFFASAVMLDDQGLPTSRNFVTIKQVEYTAGQSAAITVDTSDVTTTAPTSEQAVVGWNRNETAANAGTVEGTNGVITLYADGNASDIGDVTLFPAITNAYWLYFDENDGGTGGGASYTPPQFVMPGQKPKEPTAPHRTGYTFGGWYKDAACTQSFSFDVALDMTRTVYAKWVGDSTTYTVVVWVQRTSDSANLPTNGQNVAEADRTYDFYKAYTINSTTGNTATVANTYKQLATGSSSELYNHGHVKFNRCDADKTVEGNGSTVMNVYYDRDVMTIHWRYSQNGSDFDTWYGLYGARLSDAGKEWKTPDSGYKWRTQRYSRLVYQDSFEDFDYEQDVSLVIYREQDTTTYYDYYFYTENVDGTWKLEQQIDKNRQTSFTLSEKFTGFHVYQYSHNGSTWNTATQGSSINTNGNFYVRYQRNVWTLSFRNGARGTSGSELRADSVKFDESLTNHASPANPTYPVAADADHYEFTGWFADTAWTTMVTFTELTEQQKQNYRDWYGVSTFVVYDKMPNSNLVLYAGYHLKGWDCALNPNGGTLTNENQAGLFWMDYGDKFSADLKTNITREGYIFQGWMVASVPKDADGNLVILGYATDANNHRYVTNFSNWTITDDPWEFNTPISGATALMAKWFYREVMHVVYDAGAGTNAPTDRGEYSDHATTVAFHAPNPPDDKNFLGWDIQGTTTVEKLMPGDTFEISSDYAVDGVVTLVAVYSGYNGEEDEVPVTHIDWYANNTETGTYAVKDDEGVVTNVTLPLHVTDADMQLNAPVAIRAANTFSNTGYTFLGWAKLHSDNGTMKDHKGNTVTAADSGMDYALTEDNLYLKYEDGVFKVLYNGEWTATTQVAADERTPYDDMYAVWSLKYFYVYHSFDCTIEKVPMDGEHWNSDGTFRIADLTKDGALYGGYYSDYAGKGTFDLTAITAFPYTVADGTPYVGNKIDNAEAWTLANAYTVSGLAMAPESDTLYYLKEVPETKYLQPYLHYTYHKADGAISSAWLISDVDDLNYTQTGFVIVSNNKAASVTASLKVSTTNGGNAITLTAKRIFTAKGVTSGYLSYLEVMSGTVATNGFGENVTVLQYWVTLDGLIVTSANSRYYTGINKKADIKKFDNEGVASTIAVFAS